jgi:hypothetical protein
VPREPTLGELADDVEKLTVQVQRLGDRLDNAPYVRRDLHDEQINNVRKDIHAVQTSTTDGMAGLRTMQMWMLGVMGSILVAAVVAVIANVVGSGA